MANPLSEETVATQLETPTSSTADKPQTFLFFGRLPSEIRQIIWLMTFSPRVIQIMIHPDTGHGSRSRAVGYFFTASEDLIAIRPSYTALGSSTYHPSPALSKPYPRGPTALRVCRESREVALKHYELAFGPFNLKPSEDAEFSEPIVGSGEKKIWVDFGRDLIAILHHNNQSPNHLTMKPNHPLYLMTISAKEETKKIQRLAVSECRYPASHPARRDRLDHGQIVHGRHGPRPDHPTASPRYFDETTGFHRESASSYLGKFFKEFKSIKELEVYEIGGRQSPFNIDGLPILKNDFLDADMALCRTKLLDFLEFDKKNTSEWTADLPSIAVRKGLHSADDRWDGMFMT